MRVGGVPGSVPVVYTEDLRDMGLSGRIPAAGSSFNTTEELRTPSVPRRPVITGTAARTSSATGIGMGR
jgi:hypothetical protein